MKKSGKVSDVMSNCVVYSVVLLFGIYLVKFFFASFVFKDLQTSLEGWEIVPF